MPLAEVMTAARRRGLGAERMVPLERAGLMALNNGLVSFRHPLLQSAVYATASATALAEALRALAETTMDTGRVAWHGAAASVEPDETVAASLENAARRVKQRGAQAEASAAFARAARLRPGVPNRGRRFAAAQSAYLAGQMDDAGLLLREAMAQADDPASIMRTVTTHLSLSMISGVPGPRTVDFLGFPHQRLALGRRGLVRPSRHCGATHHLDDLDHSRRRRRPRNFPLPHSPTSSQQPKTPSPRALFPSVTPVISRGSTYTTETSCQRHARYLC
ncbi:hypothetical protein AB0869_14745 [Micromonospora vinacea]|uniref:hypothetical protein n=1 Tax=Micromonospora vinacea TaxID=709878 RepID=UPI0034570B9A